ncbi:MAG: aromatic acid decarboxylase [unclassified Hahellaceae]|nr:aromatic acid decarboxylase [Hahellaceae bacterium]|tara:strand:- start:75782 stop:76405 length:624 start_codon:yes stop_codon:yes gene_type:complete
MKTVTLAITGASGFQYGLRLLEVLLQARHRVYLLVSKAAYVVAATELDLKLPAQAAALQQYLIGKFKADPEQIRVFGKEDWMSPVASGSGSPECMVICPCSTGTLAAVANGLSNNLIERAADVVLKERKKLILVPRESPFSTIHLQNMLTLSQAGAVILPAAPGFYHKPRQIEDLIDFVVARILQQLDIPQTLMPVWGRTNAGPEVH